MDFLLFTTYELYAFLIHNYYLYISLYRYTSEKHIILPYITVSLYFLWATPQVLLLFLRTMLTILTSENMVFHVNSSVFIRGKLKNRETNYVAYILHLEGPVNLIFALYSRQSLTHWRPWENVIISNSTPSPPPTPRRRCTFFEINSS